MPDVPLRFPLEPAPRDATPDSPPSPPPAKSRGRRALRTLARAVLAVLLGYYVACLVLLVVYRFAAPPITGVQLERRIEAAMEGRRYAMRRRFVPLTSMSPHLGRAVVAAEDGRFWSHWGYDLKEMRAAGKEALGGEGMRGASTITQQLVKNLFGCTCRNPVRKIYDLALALPAHLILGRERVLELYLNTVEWGPGVFGADAAARHHFGRRARDLSRSQAAGLAALLPNPLKRTPRTTGEYREDILRRMESRGW